MSTHSTRPSSVTAEDVRAHRERDAVRSTSTVGDLCAFGLSTDDERHVRACADAELQGDPALAWHHFRQTTMSQESPHAARLRLLAELGSQAPGWMWSRWMTVQARRPLWTGATESGDTSPDLVRAVEIAYPDDLPATALDGLSMPLFVLSLHERDWLLRQLTVYESGGLRRLVRDHAGVRLLDRADQPGAWATAPMSGYRLLGDHRGVVRVQDLGSGQTLDLLDLGLGCEHRPGQTFLGRVVPTSSGPGQMFEWRPLPVGKVTAQRVADDPDGWLDVVTQRSHRGVLRSMWSYVGDEELVADLPTQSWMGLLDHDAIETVPHRDGLVSWDDVAASALDRLLRAVGTPGVPAEVLRHFAWTLLLRPGIDEVVRLGFVSQAHVRAWRALAEVLTDPVAQRCTTYAELGAGRAA